MTEILNLIVQFGPIIVLAGTFFEGEIFAILGGFLAYRGVYPFETMLILSFVGSFVGDLSVFLFARIWTNHRWIRRWRERKRFARALHLVERYQAFFVIVNRYIYGLRMPGLIALGLSRMSIPRFALLNFLGAALWSGIFTTLGFVFGYSIQSLFANLEMVEHGVITVVIIAAIALVGYVGWRQWGPIIKGMMQRRRARKALANPEHEKAE